MIIASIVFAYMLIADIVAMRHRDAEWKLERSRTIREVDSWWHSFVFGLLWPISLPARGWFDL